ncbi:MAG: c-type cytochrome [Bacillota bacterium]
MSKRSIRWLSLLVFPWIVVFFQNCSDFTLQNQIMSGASLLNSQAILDSQVLPALTDPNVSGSTLIRWYKEAQPSYVDKVYAGADQLSFVVAFDRTMEGRVFAANSGSDDMEETNITVSSGKIRVNRIFSSGNLAYADVNLPSMGDIVVVGLATTSDPSKFSLEVNGVVQMITVNTTGSPQTFSYVTKALVAGSTGGKVYEYAVYNSKLSNAQLNSMSRYIGASVGSTQVIFDPAVLDTSSDGGTTVDNSKFLAAKAVIDSNCLSCHGSGSSLGDFSNMTELNMINKGMVVAKAPLSSPLYYRLQGSQGGGNKNMPQGGSISAAQVQAVYDWIANIP